MSSGASQLEGGQCFGLAGVRHMVFLIHSLQHASEGDVVDLPTHVVNSVLQWLVLLALFRAHAATSSNIRAAPRFLAVLIAWPQGLVPGKSGMATVILGLSIEVVGVAPLNLQQATPMPARHGKQAQWNRASSQAMIGRCDSAASRVTFPARLRSWCW